MAKQPCFYDHSTTVSNRDYDRLNIDALLDLIDTSFDHLVDSRSTDSHHDDFTDRALHLGSVILEAGKRSARKQSTVHNTSIWPLTIDLTVKVFSMLNTRSTCIAAATCLFFQQCAKDPSCYTNIDLACVPHKIILSKFNSDVASSVIERSGNALQ